VFFVSLWFYIFSMRDYSDKIKLLVAPIAQDNSSGSSELSKRAAVALLDLLDDIEGEESSEATILNPALLQFSKSLLQAQPQMATLFNLVNRALLISSSEKSFGEARSAIEKFIYSFLAVVVGGSDNIAQQALPLISDGSVILLHSYSGTVVKALISARRQGKSFEVYCTESRPVMEGRRTATVLSAAGIPVTYILDAAIFYSIQRATLVLCGADAITIDGIINKTGTTLISIAACAVNRPVYVLADSTKFLPSSYCLSSSEAHPRSEIWPEAPQNITIANRYFELTPLESFAAVINENGLFDIKDVKSHLNSLQVSSELCAEL
jgi:translation initiation factor eIF-2B subunit delta